MVKLKPFDLQNVGIHYQWNNDEELNFYDSDYPHKSESFESFITRIKDLLNNNPTSELLEIHLQENNELIGVVGIHDIDYYNKRCTIECTIGDRQYWHKGYGTEAVIKALGYCYNEIGMNKVSTTAFDFNKTWIGLIQTVGFKREGALRQHTLKKGEFHDKLIYGILKSEYKNTWLKATI